MFLCMHLAARIEDTEHTGIWVDYCAMPQRRQTPDQRERTEAEGRAMKALLRRLYDLQMACSQDILCGSSVHVADFASRAWCVCELYISSLRPGQVRACDCV